MRVSGRLSTLVVWLFGAYYIDSHEYRYTSTECSQPILRKNPSIICGQGLRLNWRCCKQAQGSTARGRYAASCTCLFAHAPACQGLPCIELGPAMFVESGEQKSCTSRSAGLPTIVLISAQPNQDHRGWCQGIHCTIWSRNG